VPYPVRSARPVGEIGGKFRTDLGFEFKFSGDLGDERRIQRGRIGDPGQRCGFPVGQGCIGPADRGHEMREVSRSVGHGIGVGQIQAVLVVSADELSRCARSSMFGHTRDERPAGGRTQLRARRDQMNLPMQVGSGDGAQRQCGIGVGTAARDGLR
jgi:hypothetical protein